MNKVNLRKYRNPSGYSMYTRMIILCNWQDKKGNHLFADLRRILVDIEFILRHEP